MSSDPIRICFVCLGNICRSPTAEGVMRHLAREAGLEKALRIASAGTGGWHVGAQSDPRSRAEALRRGVKLTSRAQKFQAGNFDDYDYVLAMDRHNHGDLANLAAGPDDLAKLHMLRSFDPASVAAKDLDVPDPYYGEGDGFARVYDICEAGCRGLLAHLREKHGL
jgi:protein-tyrosine phosphatase